MSDLCSGVLFVLVCFTCPFLFLCHTVNELISVVVFRTYKTKVKAMTVGLE